MKLTIYTVHCDIHNAYDPSVTVHTTLAAYDAHLRGIIEDAIRKEENTEDFDTLSEIGELERLLALNDVDQAWEVFTEGFNGNTEPQVKHPDDFYCVEEHEIEVPEPSALRELRDAATEVIANWEEGDLAGAVNTLRQARDEADAFLAN